MIRPPTIAPGTEVNPPRISTGSAFSAMSDSENWTPLLAPHMTPATRATRPETDHTITQIVLSGMPIDIAACVVVGDRPESAADPRPLEEDRQDRHQHRRP